MLANVTKITAVGWAIAQVKAVPKNGAVHGVAKTVVKIPLQ